jgi:penicillin amidase
MSRDLTRRTLLAALAGAGPAAAALSPVGGFLNGIAPLSGSVWRSMGAAPEAVEGPHGDATITYDDYHVPHVRADTEEAAYFAVGYAQAADRLAQMDLFRRRAEGTLAAAVGEPGVENDRFAAKMDFRGAAEASREAIAGTETEAAVQAFADGINTYIQDQPPGAEFDVLGYEPEEWTVVDTALVGTLLSWSLTGSFATLRDAVLRETFDAETYRQLYPDRLDHGVPIIRPEETGGEITGVGGEPPAQQNASASRTVDPGLIDWLESFEPAPHNGSNGWVISGDVTASGEPIVCNDPHLTLQAPPIWYQVHTSIGDRTERGAAIVGTPFPVIGENDHGAWGVTNVGADVIDFYTYETDGDRYRYDGEWREFETETRTIEVAGGENEDIEIRKTVHGVYVDREVNGEERAVGVAWTGMSDTREIQAIHGWARSSGIEEFHAATEQMDVPTQNVHYADSEGNTLYQMSGKIPVRHSDGEVIRGDRVFDGSSGEGEWDGFEPFGHSTWEGFIPYEEKPSVRNADYVATANQRTADDPTYPIGQYFASGFRATRIEEKFEDALAEGTVDRDFARSLQTDTLSVRARMLVPAMLEARDEIVGASATPDTTGEWLDALVDWDYQMDPDSRGALLFIHFYEAFREATWADDFDALGLDDSYWPQEWVLVTLPPDSDFFDGDRAAVMADAVATAIERIEEEGWETYGDYNVTAIDHPFGGSVPGLNYDRHAAGGAPMTVWAFSTERDHGASYRLLADFGGNSLDVIPGGNDGSPFGSSYEDQLAMWANGEYRQTDDPPEGDPNIAVEGVER